MNHLQEISHLMPGHQLDRWYLNQKNKRGPKIDHRGTPVFTPVHNATCAFKVTLCLLSLSNLLKTQTKHWAVYRKYHFALVWRLYPCAKLYQTLLRIKENSSHLHVSWIIDKCWLIQVWRLETSFIWGNQIVFNKKPENFIKT